MNAPATPKPKFNVGDTVYFIDDEIFADFALGEDESPVYKTKVLKTLSLDADIKEASPHYIIAIDDKDPHCPNLEKITTETFLFQNASEAIAKYERICKVEMQWHQEQIDEAKKSIHSTRKKFSQYIQQEKLND